MKVIRHKSDVERIGDFEEVEFGMVASPQAFEVLSSGIYSDKIRAVIRELSTNALDSHIEAGTPERPFSVTLPTRLDPRFAIRDYGIGLSPEDVKTVYTKYFKSTKTQTNDLNGFLGLGSKSPFSYTAQFSITSWFNGQKATFTAFKSEANKPTLACHSVEPSDEENGIEVSFAVKEKDVYEFTSKAGQVYQWFPVRPTFSGNRPTINKPTYVFEGDGYGVINKNDYNYNESAVIMANVAYPIVSEEFSGNGKLDAAEIELVDSWGIHLFVPTGHVEVTASREKLSYTPRTVKHLRQFFKKIVEDIKVKVQGELSSAANYWTACSRYVELSDNLFGKIVGFSDDVEWNSKKLIKTIPLGEESDFPNVSIEELTFERRRSRHSGQLENLRKYKIYHLVPQEKKTIFANDMERGGYASAEFYMKVNGITKALMFNKYDVEFFKEYGMEDIVIYTSTLPRPERKSRVSYGSYGRERTAVQLLDNSMSGRDDYGQYRHTELANLANYWTNSQIDLKETSGFYVETSHDKWLAFPTTRFQREARVNDEVGRPFVHPCFLLTVARDYMAYSNNTSFQLYGMKSALVKKIKENPDKYPGWVNFNDHVLKLVSQFPDIEAQVLAAEAWKHAVSEGAEVILTAAEGVENKVLQTVVDNFLELKSHHKDEVYHLIKLRNHTLPMDFVWLNRDYTSKVVDILSPLKKVYPLLKHLTINRYDDDLAAELNKYFDSMNPKKQQSFIECDEEERACA